MYEYLNGTIKHIAPTYLVLEVNNIGFKILTANPFKYQGDFGKLTTIYTEQIIREDAHTLYGFKDLSEKELFQTLIKVSGIGPKSALSILAADDHIGLVNAIESGDSQYLTKFPGVGKKTAQQMVLDLKGELSEWASIEDTTGNVTTVNLQSTAIFDETTEALIGLGYSAREIKRIEKSLKEAKCQTTQEALSLAFKLLLNK